MMEKETDRQTDRERARNIKGSKECYLLGQNNLHIFGVISPLRSYKTTLKQQLNGEKQ